tara:strand:- start:137 stop:577 length:441 start_codon:yes stop_codon:yes gene_type:complete
MIFESLRCRSFSECFPKSRIILNETKNATDQIIGCKKKKRPKSIAPSIETEFFADWNRENFPQKPYQVEIIKLEEIRDNSSPEFGANLLKSKGDLGFCDISEYAIAQEIPSMLTQSGYIPGPHPNTNHREVAVMIIALNAIIIEDF